ncbi:putative Cytochrome P450 [Seiridium unicorne]|uniref:Cytochrome P450 n=1 Tax=Seiridium unicorne TaxID=138068 RepID=A0ABR2VEC8_9PEZI
MYIVASPDLVAACDRRAKIVSFAPYVVAFAKRILAASQDSIALLSEDLLEDKRSLTLRPETMKVMHRALMPGEGLDEILQTVIEEISSFCDTEIGNGNQTDVPLFQWIRVNYDLIRLERAVDKDFALLGLRMLPSLIAPVGSSGRERFFDAFRNYYAADSLKTASHFVRVRYDVNKRFSVSTEDIAHFDLGICTALLVNTVPAVWWTLYHVFSEQALLIELRQGIDSVALRQSKSNPDRSTCTSVSIPDIIAAFPLLESLVKEVLRVHSNSMSARLVLKDTIIEDGRGAAYLLKTGSFLAMPSAPIHASEDCWGPRASTFDPSRFLSLHRDKMPRSAYRAFGGGNALCPGRHFAMNEIMSILVIVVMRYDIVPLDGQWRAPRTRDHISTSVMTPAKDFPVRIQPRESHPEPFACALKAMSDKVKELFMTTIRRIGIGGWRIASFWHNR